MFGLFTNSTPVLSDYAFLGTDFHAHWLPAIDDGSPDMEHTLAMLREFESLGFSRLVASPHVMVDMYRNTPGQIIDRLAEVRAAAKAAGIGLQLEAAAEYMLDEGFERLLRDGDVLTIAGDYVLVEFGFYAAPYNLKEIIFEIQTAGLRPIIAHPERYSYYSRDAEELRVLHRRGAHLQVNLLSLTGHYGKRVGALARQLLEEGLVDYLGTDAHSLEHLEKIRLLLSNRKMGQLIKAHQYKNNELLPA